ncbi:MAG: LOG family protein [bacterium]|nr:LOG family protein [bacterium]
MPPAPTPDGVAVFGSSEPLEGEPAYEQAREMGHLLAGAGHRVLTGGYGGVMEAASRGAREAGGATLGITCSIFSSRDPNGYLSEAVETPDLYERTRGLIDRARAFVVLHGKSGTLSELTFLWALHRSGCLDGRAVVLLGSAWADILRCLRRNEMLEDPEFRITAVAGSPREALQHLERSLNDR